MASPQLDLLRCATEPPETAVALWHGLLAAVPLDDFDYPAQRLLPAVWKNLKAAGLEFAEEGRLRGVYRQAWARNARLRGACCAVLDLFDSHQLPALVLKGLAFNALLYADQGQRPTSDFDLLVPFERAAEAVSMMHADGWVTPDPSLSPYERLHHGMTWKKNDCELDLHFFLLREARLADSDLPFWREAVSFDLGGGRQALTLSPSHHFFHLLVIANREPENRTRYLLDLHFLARAWRDQIDPSEVARMLEERHLLSRLAGLPLKGIGLDEVQRQRRPSLTDRAWCEATRTVHDGSHEWHYLLFPFLDYWLHFRNQPQPGWGFPGYIKRRLEIQGLRDLLKRTGAKLQRMASQRWR